MIHESNTTLYKHQHLEPDITPELKDEEVSYFQSIIRILRWAMELGHINICGEVSVLSSHLALP
jgi:hypothetical protein